MDDKSTRGSSERRRTFTGCRTCRERHVKCDGVRPGCGPCEQRSLVCGGYGFSLLWLSEGNSVSLPNDQSRHRASKYRYPIFTESQRWRMSDQLSDSLGHWSPSELITRLDDACWRKESNGRYVDGLCRGPFRAFSSRRQGKDDTVAIVAASVEGAMRPRETEATVDTVNSGEAVNSVNTVNSVEPAEISDPAPVPLEGEAPVPFENLSWLDSFAETPGMQNMALEDLMGSVDPMNDLDNLDNLDNLDSLDNATAASPLLDLAPFLHDALGHPSPVYAVDTFTNTVVSDGDKDRHSEEPLSPSSQNRCQSVMSIRGPDLTPAEAAVLPAHAETLLRHYNICMNEGESDTTNMEGHHASPWQLILFPCLLQAFAELSLWRSTSDTRSALLYSLLALSAFRLHSTTPGGGVDFLGEPWLEIGVRYQQRAQCRLRAALGHEMTGAGPTKYKELLMAILAISTISLSRGGRSFQVFLLDAERFIRRQGLSDKIVPFEFRLLHHMYSHLRILAESVGSRLERPTDDPRRAYNEPPEKGGRFCLAVRCYSVGLDPAFEKDPDLGYSDIHLQIQGQWRQSLYQQIFGFPESLWTLLSQTVNTANEKVRIESLEPHDPVLTAALGRHIQGLESSLWAWTPWIDAGAEVRPAPADERQLHHHHDLSHALHQALLLYFYRRVVIVSAHLLQDTVARALDHLEPCVRNNLCEDQNLTVCIAWAALIAACEATTPTLRARSRRLLLSIDDKGVFLTNRPAVQVAELVWKGHHGDNMGKGSDQMSWQPFIQCNG